MYDSSPLKTTMERCFGTSYGAYQIHCVLSSQIDTAQSTGSQVPGDLTD
jgi:hypothetical protein